MFDQWDLNKDGAITLEELQTFYAKRRPSSATTTAQPAAPPVRPMKQDFVPDAPIVGEVNGSCPGVPQQGRG